MEKPSQQSNNSKDDNYVKPPSFFQMAKSFTKDLAKYVKEGAPNVTPKDYEKRLDTCRSCEFLIEKSMRCGACGCLLEHKAKWKTADCPKEKWEKQVLSKEEQKEVDRVEKEKEKSKKEKEIKNPPQINNESNFYYDENGIQVFTSPPIMPTPGQLNVRTIPVDKIEEWQKQNAEKVKNAKRQEDNNTDPSN